jgi:hypothetical protein
LIRERGDICYDGVRTAQLVGVYLLFS